ncbi:HD domain-containing protein [Streptacidiphilus sp. ASG 303]|uniref:HD-GYP domain-containing protein n=1 Tax=Streptacidiphilus sp. ASG 303 TaxID=2896847 RepID=UPI001E60ED94|nr:HD domain-containing phosphohydrolase [Streptacidiphilus sp. ASG 303]MCD0482856.1 HD domain-containing protein [Streptacidiphilus sp. ASG 303]
MPLAAVAAVHAAAVALVLAAAAAVLAGGLADVRAALAFGALIAAGEAVRITLPGDRELAPVGAAGALAYALLGPLRGLPTGHGVLQTVAVTAAAGLLGTLPYTLRGRPPQPDRTARRLLTTAFAAALFQPLYNSGALDRVATRGAQYGLVLAAAAVLAALFDVVLAALLRSARARIRFGPALVAELHALPGIGSAIAATGLVISLGAGEVGLWALPVFSVPLLLTQLSFRRYGATAATRRQSVAALARATEVAGYTLPGHARRVAALSRAVGSRLGLPGRDLELLECAALMHDIGQLSLVEPVPGGATALLPPEEQRRIARLGSEVIRHTGVPPEVAVFVELQARPYRTADGRRDPAVPTASRIIRAANAYDDLVCDDPRLARRLEVLEQLRLETGRAYDPRVVEALTAVCTGAGPAGPADDRRRGRPAWLDAAAEWEEQGGAVSVRAPHRASWTRNGAGGRHE